MNGFLKQSVFAAILIVLPQLASSAFACSCFPLPTPYRAYREAKAVFVGKVVGVRDSTETERHGNNSYSSTERYFRFAVSESLKGIKGPEVELSAGRIDSSCYSGFTEGESYLVYAYGESEKSLSAGMCTRTTGLSDASGELYYLHGLLKGMPEPRVYGSVIRIDSDLTNGAYRATPMNGIKIVVEGEDRKFEAVTNKLGVFNFSKVPDGEYVARVILPEKYRAYFPEEEKFILGPKESEPYLRVRRGTSAYAGFRIGWNNSVSGTILDAEGNPVVRVKSAVMLPGKSSRLLAEDYSNHRPEGKFDHHGLTPGKYLLSAAVRIPSSDQEKPLRFFFPNVDDVKLASEITIGEHETLEGRDIRLPPGFVVRQIEGVVVWPNDVPVSGAWVFLAASLDSQDDDQKYDWVTTDELGRFSLQAFVGYEYWIHARSDSSGKGEPVKVNVAKLNQSVKVVIPFPKP